MISNTIKNFFVGYQPISGCTFFTSGDFISGKITLELIKECKVQSLCVKLKGQANVSWTEGFGEDLELFHSNDKYFSVLQFVIQESPDCTILSPGVHVYPFTFQIPTQQLPSSFYSKFGTIQYKLEANLSRPKRLDSKTSEAFDLINKADLNVDPALMAPQHGVLDKRMRLFNSGTVGMDVNVAQTGFHQGEDIKVVASFQNNTSRDVKAKYCLYSKQSFFASGKRKVETEEILKEVGDVIPPSTTQSVSQTFTIPPDTAVSILNCDILRVEYRLKVYLDVKYAFDPEMNFPIVVLPAVKPSERASLGDPASGPDEGSNCGGETPPPLPPPPPPPPTDA